ncbi:unnamed protein product [Withania somnifera]
MSTMKVCVLFRPLNSKELSEFGDAVSVQGISSESFIIKDEKEQEFDFTFDRVFYQGSEQADIYEFLALPTVQGALDAINGTIITYGQTGAGKTYSMEGPSIVDCESKKKGLLQRVVDGLFEATINSKKPSKYTIKLSMIYMEKVRDLFDLSKDNIQIKESKVQGVVLNGATEVNISNPAEALQSLSSGIANRAVGETQMNMSSSRSHCLYIFTIQQDLTKDKRTEFGKLILVDLAGSEKVEKTGDEGKILEEAKTINQSLTALGKVINAMTSSIPGKPTHIPYRDSKLTQILQDALLRERLTAEDVQLLEKLFVLEGIFFYPNSVDEIEAAYEDVTSRTISSLHKALEELSKGVEKMKRENASLKASLKASEEFYQHQLERRPLCLIL